MTNVVGLQLAVCQVPHLGGKHGKAAVTYRITKDQIELSQVMPSMTKKKKTKKKKGNQ